jgi:hypothetical protein
MNGCINTQHMRWYVCIFLLLVNSCLYAGDAYDIPDLSKMSDDEKRVRIYDWYAYVRNKGTAPERVPRYNGDDN